MKALTAAARDTTHTQRLMRRSTAHVETLILGPGAHRETQQGDQIPAGLGSLRKLHQGSPLLSETLQSPQWAATRKRNTGGLPEVHAGGLTTGAVTEVHMPRTARPGLKPFHSG